MIGWQSGDGYLSDDSSFYGDDDQRHALDERAAKFYKEDYERLWGYCAASINNLAHKLNSTSGHERTEPDRRELYNCYEGQEDARQLGESVDDFLKRLPPLEYRENCGPWIWIANPYAGSESDEEADLARFMKRSRKALEVYEGRKRRLLETNPEMKPATVTRRMGSNRDQLKDDILRLAVECKVTSGKWMLFVPPEHVPKTWKLVAHAVAEARLGISAKIATDGEDVRLICIYTANFNDKEDVARVLQEIAAMDLLPRDSKRGIYYKADAYTHLGIEGNNEYGLRASLYGSKDFTLHPKTSQKRPPENKTSRLSDDWSM